MKSNEDILGQSSSMTKIRREPRNKEISQIRVSKVTIIDMVFTEWACVKAFRLHQPAFHMSCLISSDYKAPCSHLHLSEIWMLLTFNASYHFYSSALKSLSFLLLLGNFYFCSCQSPEGTIKPRPFQVKSSTENFWTILMLWVQTAHMLKWQSVVQIFIRDIFPSSSIHSQCWYKQVSFIVLSWMLSLIFIYPCSENLRWHL